MLVGATASSAKARLATKFQHCYIQTLAVVEAKEKVVWYGSRHLEKIGGKGRGNAKGVVRCSPRHLDPSLTSPPENWSYTMYVRARSPPAQSSEIVKQHGKAIGEVPCDELQNCAVGGKCWAPCGRRYC